MGKVSPGAERRESLVTKVAVGCGMNLLFYHDLRQTLPWMRSLAFRSLHPLTWWCEVLGELPARVRD